MTFKSTLTIVLIVISNSIFAQQHHWEWAKKIGSVGKEEIIAMEIRDNFLYVCGSYQSSSLNWDGIVLNNAGGNDFFVAKLDTNGNAIWAKSFGTAAFDTVQQMEVNANGTCLLRCFSSANSIALDGNNLNNPGDFLFTINNNGSVILVKRIDPRIRCQDVDLDNTGAIYVGGLYPNAFTFGSTTMDSTYCRSGGAVLKYSSTGTPLWASNIQFFVGYYNPADPFSPLPLDTILFGDNYFNSCRMSIASSRFDSSLYMMFGYLGNVFYNGTLINNGTSYRGATFYAHLQPNGTSIYQIGTYLPTNGRSTFLYDVEAGANGLCYSSNSSLGLSLVQNYYLKSSADSTRTRVASWIDQNSTPVNPIFRPNDTRINEFNTSEDGVYLLGDVPNYPFNKLQLFDSSTNALTGVCLENTTITRTAKAFSNLQALYFGGKLNSSTVLNGGIAGASNISLTPVDGQDIFIGKYSLRGQSNINISSQQTEYKICSDSVRIGAFLDCPNASAGYTYQWSPSTGLSDSHVLNPNVFIAADTVVYTLTVTAPDGGTSSKAFTVIKIPYADLHLNTSNLHPCIGDTVNMTLSGTNFYPVVMFQSPWQQYVSSPSGGWTFNSLTDTIKFRFNSNHFAYIQLNPANPSVCLQTPALYITTPTGTATSFQYDTACLNSTYQFPDGTTATVIGDSIQHISQITCSQSITTIVRTAPTYLINRTVNICAGNNYTFEDGTVATNIQDTTVHQSHFSTLFGCDSIVQTKVIPVSLPAYTPDTTVVHLCSGVSYTFLDGTSFTASNNFDHVNHFTTLYGCDSISVTRIVVHPTYRPNLFATVCNGGSYTFADGVIQTNITSNITHVSNFQTINGCDSIITENIAAQIVPTPNPQQVSVCLGSNFILPNGSTVFSLQHDTTIDITYPNSNGCNIREIFNLSVIGTDTGVQLNGLTFSANNTPGYAYQWINCISNAPIIGANGNSYLVTVAGDYAVEITNGNCKDTSSCYTITTQQIANGGRLIANAYPNPVHNQLQLDIQSDETNTASLNIYNMNGFLVVQSTYALQRGNNHYTIPMERFANGQYQIMITRADGVVVRKSFLKL